LPVDAALCLPTRRALDRSRPAAGFQVLEAVRQYCAERLNPSAEQGVRERHARYYRELIGPAAECDGAGRTGR